MEGDSGEEKEESDGCQKGGLRWGGNAQNKGKWRGHANALPFPKPTAA